MKKIFTLFAALTMVLSMSAATKTIYCKMAQDWWKASGAAVGAYAWKDGGATNANWPGVRMTKVDGETDLWSIDIDTDKYNKIIFTRVNGSGNVSDWGAKSADQTIPTDDKNLFTITSTSAVWGDPGVVGNWSVYAPDAPKVYKDITITIVASATPKIHYWNGGDKVIGTEWESKPDMVATGEANTYSYTIKDVDEAIGVNYLIVVGDLQSTDQIAFENVTKNFKELLPQVVLKGIDGDWGETNKMTIADDYLSASITLPLTAKDYEWKLTVNGEWFGGGKYVITRNTTSLAVTDNVDGNGKLTADIEGDYVFTYTYATKTLVVTYPALPDPEPEYMDFELPINNSVFDTETMAFSGSHTDYAIEVSLIPDMEKPIEGEEMTFGLAAASTITREGNPMEIIEGQITVVDIEAPAANAIVAAKFGEEYHRFHITMTKEAAAIVEVAIEGATVAVEEATGVLNYASTWTYEEVTYPVSVRLAGYEEGKTEYAAAQVAELQIGVDGDDDLWLDWAVANEADVAVEGEIITLEAYFTSYNTDTTYHVIISGDLPAKTISYELNGGELPAAPVPTQDSLIAAFKDGYNAYFGVSVVTTRAIDNFLYAGSAALDGLEEKCDVSLFMNDDVSPWKWLGDYILAVTNAQIEAGTLSTLKELATELMWRQSLTGFFLQQAKLDSNYKGNADFTEAGKPEAWGPAYQAVHTLVLPTEPVEEDYVLPTPTKEGYIFVGWYDNAEGDGDAYSSIPAGWYGTLYAIWKVAGPATDVDNISTTVAPVKVIENGQLIIINNGVRYNVQGAVIK